MKNSNPSQESRILRFLKTGRKLTPLLALKRFGCFRLAARIHQLRKHHDIRQETITRGGKKFASYSLAS